ncbi:putative transcriptional regulator [Malaciobacter marinus]|uniref:Putative transcriptional regulator n=1 Tax=Malaciobacter marinus TaxID=505249 RepID=A0A347TMM4_9BACT|nr:winged helix-turn-helix domain-containing protein [Malaciobacter marinus]AXX87852.1 putative transcriptional regulator [Malaciobacter marinus]PHO16136.1 hypothetical protein CPH92_03270 [Malaciobacter marinus]
MNLNLTDEQQQKLTNKLKEKKQSFYEYLTSLVLKDIEGKYDLGKGFYYELYSDKLFNKKDEEIKLTKTQKNIITYLINNNTEKISAEELYEKCWEKNKFSIFTVRNVIKQIRDKTYYNMLNNKSNVGYTIYPN